jgi:hypothetical protein
MAGKKKSAITLDCRQSYPVKQITLSPSVIQRWNPKAGWRGDSFTIYY